jgi:pimeloyl-ACP methyl ester carboxylesterase
MKTIYFISGLGADEKVFQYLDLSFSNPVFIKWIPPLPNETLGNYAARLKGQFIHDANPFIIGLSLGGMIAVEIAKSIPSAKIIIVSSAKTKQEIPFYWKIFLNLPVYKILSPSLIKHSSVIQQYFLGAHSNLCKQYLKEAMRNADIKFYKWAIEAILTWQNKTVPSNIVHIHGKKDKLLPYGLVKPDIPVAGGGHLMIIENAGKVSVLLKRLFLPESEAEAHK